MSITEFVAAIEISSSKLLAIVGKKGEDNSLNILAFAEANASFFMNKGMIFNTDKASKAIESVIKRLELQLSGPKIAKVYIGINTFSTRSIKNQKTKKFEETTQITAEHLDALKDANAEEVLNLKNTTLLDIIPQEYKVGTLERVSPTGIPTADPLVGSYVNIVGRKSIVDNLNSCFENLKYTVADIFLSHITSAELLIDDYKRKNGCAYINFGAETTALSIYKKNILRYHVVIPLGGNSLTRDLTYLKIDYDRAENLKQAHGNLIYKENDSKDPQTLYLDSKTKEEVTHVEFNAILAARQEEIILNIWSLIKEAGYEHELNEGIIYTGEASKIKGLKDFITNITKINKVSECMLNIPQPKYSKVLKHFFDEAQMSRLAIPISLVLKGNENCAEINPTDTPNIFATDNVINTQDSNEEQILKEVRENIESSKKIEELEIQAARIKKERSRQQVVSGARIDTPQPKKEKKKKPLFGTAKKWFNDTLEGFSNSAFNENEDDQN